MIGSHVMDPHSSAFFDPTAPRRELVEARAIFSETAGVTVTDAALPLGL